MPGVSVVIRLQTQEKKFLDDKIATLERLGLVEVDKVQMESCVYRTVSDQVKCHNFQVFTHSDFPATCFVLNDAEPDKMLTCDLSFREFPGLLKGVYEIEKKLQIEGSGVKYRIGDFDLNYISLTLGNSQSIRGLILEIIFRPTCLPAASGKLLQAFGQQFFPELFANTAVPVFTATLKKAFMDTSTLDKSSPESLIAGRTTESLSRAAARVTVTQYVEHLRELRSPS